MTKKLSILMIILLSLFVCAFDAVYFSEMETPETNQDNEISENFTVPDEGTVIETGSDEPGYTDETGNFDGSYDQDIPSPIGGENQEGENNSDPSDTEEQIINEVYIEPEPTEEPAAPVWMDIDEDQVNILYALYSAMTDNGKSISGWFQADDYAPCTWNGITCEAGRVTELSFEDACFFTVFPEELLALRDLKELHMLDTLVRGPLPEKLFSALPKLEVLELKGNFLTGSIPELPAAFEFYPMLREIAISDNLEDERKTQMMLYPEYLDAYYTSLDPMDYPEIDLTPGLDGEIPENWNLLPILSEIDLSGNQLTGSVPESFAWIQLTKLDLRDNAEQFLISQELYNKLVSLGNPDIILDGIQTPSSPEINTVVEPAVEETAVPEFIPTETPAPEFIPTEVPVQTEFVVYDQMIIPSEVPTEVPTAIPTEIPTEVPTEVPTAIPTEVPTEKPSDALTEIWGFRIPVTDTPVPNYYTATPAPRYYATETPNQYRPYYYPTATPYYYQPQPYYYYPTATPYYYQQQPYYYPTATPYYYQPQPYYYPTATPYTNYNPYYVYPTATSAYQYPQYVQVRPTQTSTPVPVQNPASMLGFTYKLEAMTGNNIPMTWRYTGMSEYSINYLDASGNLYPAFAMEWTPASKVCNASACNATVTVPDDLLKQGKFSLQLRVRDAAGNIYMSDPVMMEVSYLQPTPTPVPEQPKSFLAGFFEWLFGPLIRLFGGK